MSSPTPPNKSPKELSNEVRMVLAFVLMGLILVVTPWAYRKLGITAPQSADQKQASAAKTVNTAEKAAASTSGTTTASGTPMTLSTPPPVENARGARRRRSIRRERAGIHARYRPLSRCFYQSRRYRQKLDSEEVQGQRRQTARTGESEGRRKSRLSVLIHISR